MEKTQKGDPVGIALRFFQLAGVAPGLAVPLHDRPLGRLAGDILERFGEVITIMQQEHAAASLGQEERHEGRIRLRRVALTAGEDQIVRAVVCRLAAAGPHVIKGDKFRRGFDAAIRAHRTMLRE